jgi:FAD synthetase
VPKTCVHALHFRRWQTDADADMNLIRTSFSNLSLSYNGGKDCLVLLILYLAALHTHFNSVTPTLDRRKPFPTSIPSIYARPADPFPAVTAFVASSSHRYHLDLTTHVYSKTVSFRDAFAIYLAEKKEVKAIFVGTRRTDPHGEKLTFFDRTDGGWPDFVRVHPVIDWRLEEVWTFLKAPELGELEYCSMYDEGYTSLGGVGDTVRNPKLRYVDEEDGKVRYKPAYVLVVDGEERLGRD